MVYILSMMYQSLFYNIIILSLNFNSKNNLIFDIIFMESKEQLGPLMGAKTVDTSKMDVVKLQTADTLKE